MKKKYLPNRQWAKWTCAIIGIFAILNVLTLFCGMYIVVLNLVSLVLLYFVYRLWVDYTYIFIDFETKAITQVSAYWNRTVFQVRDITKISWTGSPLDAFVLLENRTTKMLLSPALYDEATLKMITRDLVSMNPVIKFEGHAQRTLDL